MNHRHHFITTLIFMFFFSSVTFALEMRSSDEWFDATRYTKHFRCAVSVRQGKFFFEIVNCTKHTFVLRRRKNGFNFLIRYRDIGGRHVDLERREMFSEGHIERLEVLSGQINDNEIFLGCEMATSFEVEIPKYCIEIEKSVVELSYVQLQDIGTCKDMGALEALLVKRTFRIPVEFRGKDGCLKNNRVLGIGSDDEGSD